MTVDLDYEVLAAAIVRNMKLPAGVGELPEFLDVREVAEKLAITPKHVRSLIAHGDLAAFDASTDGEDASRQATRVSKKSVLEFLEVRKCRS